jgi:hypothetical protein
MLNKCYTAANFILCRTQNEFSARRHSHRQFHSPRCILSCLLSPTHAGCCASVCSTKQPKRFLGKSYDRGLNP